MVAPRATCLGGLGLLGCQRRQACGNGCLLLQLLRLFKINLPVCPSASCLLLHQVPAALQQLLQQLGCSKEAVLWAATQFNESTTNINENIVKLSDGCRRFRIHSKAFLLDSSPGPVLTLPQLHDMQQQLQLYMLLPNVLMQWVADSSDHARIFQHGLTAAMCLANMYHRCAHGLVCYITSHGDDMHLMSFKLC